MLDLSLPICTSIISIIWKMPNKPGRGTAARLQSPSPALSSDGPPAVDFRARLRSVGAREEQQLTKNLPASPHTSRKVLDQFQATFHLDLSPPPTSAKPSTTQSAEATHTSLLQLTGWCRGLFPGASHRLTYFADAFKHTGSDMHSSAAERLFGINADIKAEIQQLTRNSSAALETNAALYSNIEWPLSRTLCTGRTLPRSTVEDHLSSLQRDLSKAEDHLAGLASEWSDCVAAEDNAWKLLSGEVHHQQRNSHWRDVYEEDDVAKFQEEAEKIIKQKSLMLEEVAEVREVSLLLVSASHLILTSNLNKRYSPRLQTC